MPSTVRQPAASGAEASCPRGPGRPRDPETDERILRCALDALAADGFAGMSIDGVARAAGVSKATIYRRFADKNDLVTAAIAAFKVREPVDRDGDIHAQLVAQLEATRKRMVDNGGMTIKHQILAEAERNPELVRLHQERTIGPRMGVFAEIIREGTKRGELRDDIDPMLVAELLTGAWMARWARGAGFPRYWSKNVVDAIWPSITA